jgi:predicted transcriptional regulator
MEIKVTELENKVLQAMVQGMYAERGFSDIGIEEIAEDTNLSPKVIRGVGSSLVKKGLIYIDDRDGEYSNPNMHIWYLDSKLEPLVEHWKEEKDTIPKILIK